MSISGDVYFYNQIQRQANIASAALLLSECAQSLGWNLAAFHADIHEAALPRTTDGEFIATSMGWRIKTVREWVNVGAAHTCPLALRCSHSAEPFLWECDSDNPAGFGGTLPPEQKAVLNLYNNDVCGGVTVPVTRRGKTGYVSWCSRDHDRVKHGYEKTLSSINLLSHAFIRQYDRLNEIRCNERGATKTVLTPREIECLTWAARGRTTEEIGNILHRSPETVDFHLSNAMVKLDAKNRAHAVAIACVKGMIREL